MDRLDNNLSYEWHRALNKFHSKPESSDNWMYEAKTAADEIPRMILLFKLEREGNLPKIHQQCSRSKPVEITEGNFLTCCHGIKTRECKYLKAMEEAKVSPDQIDFIKAWTCASHMLRTPDLWVNDGFLIDESDKIYWDNVMESLYGSDE
jgi:hypothetical protein